jgi:hypothetical protein
VKATTTTQKNAKANETEKTTKGLLPHKQSSLSLLKHAMACLENK